MREWRERRSRKGAVASQSFNQGAEDNDAQRDRARIIHCAAFRRLQAKTQVFSVGENDFYRTRLTHSLEVAQIGSGITTRLRTVYADDDALLRWIPTMSQIEAICLAHDIGHPPFGHGGESALNFYMYAHGGFEGNGQTLRIVSKLGEYSEHCGLDLTRRTLLGVLKYPVMHRMVADYAAIPAVEHRSSINIDIYRPPKCIHDDEENVLAWLLATVPETDRDYFCHTEVGNGKISAKYEAFDTSLMELADDISYGVHDLEDAIAVGLVTERAWMDNVVAHIDPKIRIAGHPISFYTENLFSDRANERKRAVSKLVGYFISQIHIIRQGVFQTPLLDLNAVMSADAMALLERLKIFVLQVVIRRPELQTLEYKGQQMLLKLFEVFRENPARLLPSATYQRYCAASGKRERIICDYLSGMTDNYAIRQYHKIFSPDVGTVFDRM